MIYQVVLRDNASNVPEVWENLQKLINSGDLKKSLVNEKMLKNKTIKKVYKFYRIGFEEYGFQVDAIYNKKNKKKVFLFVKKDECEKDD